MGWRFSLKTAAIVLVLVFSIQNAFAQSESKHEGDSTQKTMHTFLEHFVGLQKYLDSDAEFSDAKNSETIASHLKALTAQVKRAKHDSNLSAENFKFSRQVLEEHLSETESIFRMGNKTYARWMANSILGICMGCHTQTPSRDHKLDDIFSLQSFKSDFDRANLLFSARDFSQASALFEKLIVTYPASLISDSKLEISIRRQAAYYSRILRSPALGEQAMEKYLKNSEIPDHDRLSLKNLATQFQNWKKTAIPDPKTSSTDEILNFANQRFEIENRGTGVEGANPRLITSLFLSGILYEHLNQHPNNPKTPEILYLLALCESESNSFFYSLADMYLKECITRFPKSAVASKCFQEYESNTTLGYTGSAGINIPNDVKSELQRLKRLIEKNGSKNKKKNLKK